MKSIKYSIISKRQLKMIYKILLLYNKQLIGWAKKNIDIWEEVRDEIAKM